MNRNTKLLLVFLLASCNSAIVIEGNDPVKPTLAVSVNREWQIMDGFGASDAWRCQMVGKYWPLEKRKAIADLLFSKEVNANGNPKGIALSIWRFYVGAGSHEQGDTSGISDEWRRAECFQKPDGAYDWTKQEGQRWFLQAAKRLGVEKFLAFTISPPVQMTINGKAFSPRKINMNIQPGKLPAYADFLVQTIDSLQKREGVTFDYLSPVNEPQWDWMAKGNGKATQEGTPATNGEIVDFIKLLSERLNAKALQTKIVFGEAGAINYLYGNVNGENRDDQINYLFGQSSASGIAGLPNLAHIISGHSYFSVWPVKSQIMHRRRIAERIKEVDPSLKYWQSEYCVLEQPGKAELPGGGGRKRDLGMKTALFVARIIHNDITIANASSWQWWTALSRRDFKDGLIYLDDGKSDGISNNDADYCKNDGYYRQSKLLWTLGNYSRFVRPGMVRVSAEFSASDTSMMISAYKDRGKKQLVVVVVNTGETRKKFQLDKATRKILSTKLTPYITSDTFNLAKGKDMDGTEIEVPKRSVVTMVAKYK
jgi:O-glycosyl hydrolase